MNSYLDRGLFLVVYAGFLYVTDYLTLQHGYVTFTSMFIGAFVLVLIGAIMQVYKNDKSKS